MRKKDQEKANEVSFRYCQKDVRRCKCAACVHFLSCMDRKNAGSRLARYMAFIDVFVLPELTEKISPISEAKIDFKVASANDMQTKRGGYCQIKITRHRRSSGKRKLVSVLLTGEENKKEIITIVTNTMIKKGWFKV